MNAVTCEGYGLTVRADGGIISLYDGAALIGSLSGWSPPMLGSDADALWDAVQWLLMYPGDGSGVGDDYFDYHLEDHLVWLASHNVEDVLLDFADACASMGSVDAELFGGKVG